MTFPSPLLTSDAVAAYRAYINALTGSRGKSIIATEEARTNTAFGTLTTPDQVAGIVLPADGLICVSFAAQWKEANVAAATASLFLSANEVQIPITTESVSASTAPSASAGTGLGYAPFVGSSTANTYRPLTSYQAGLWGAQAYDEGGGLTTPSAGGYTGNVTTGQFLAVAINAETTGPVGNPYFAVGGPAYIWAAAGTYTVSVQFKATSGAVTVKERKLWVWTLGF